MVRPLLLTGSFLRLEYVYVATLAAWARLATLGSSLQHRRYSQKTRYVVARFASRMDESWDAVFLWMDAIVVSGGNTLNQ
jgi:hypothetical protein